jgi:sec-independent protein translocase protein TatA
MLPFGFGVTEMVLLAIVAVMLFGGRLPEVAKQLGESYVQFRRGLDDIKSSINADIDATPSPPTRLPDYSNTSETADDVDVGDGMDDDYEAPSAPVFQPPQDDQ